MGAVLVRTPSALAALRQRARSCAFDSHRRRLWPARQHLPRAPRAFGTSRGAAGVSVPSSADHRLLLLVSLDDRSGVEPPRTAPLEAQLACRAARKPVALSCPRRSANTWLRSPERRPAAFAPSQSPWARCNAQAELFRVCPTRRS